MTHVRVWSRALLGVMVALAVTGAPAWAIESFQFTETQTFQHSSGPEMDTESVSGDVTYQGIKGIKETTVETIINVRADDEAEARDIREALDIVVKGAADYLEAYIDRPDHFDKYLRRTFGKDRSISVSFHVTGPTGASGSLSSVSGLVKAELVAGPLRAESVSGDVIVKDVEERVRANSVSGQVSVVDCHADVNAESVSGDVEVDNCGGDLDAESVSGRLAVGDVIGTADLSSVSGDIDAHELGGGLRAHTTSGQIDVDHQSGDLELETVSGDIVARSESKDGLLDISSHSGAVRLYADVSQIGKINVSTFSGDMRIDSDLRGRNSMGRSRGRGELSFTLGDGQVYVDMSTHSGDIYIGEL